MMTAAPDLNGHGPRVGFEPKAAHPHLAQRAAHTVLVDMHEKSIDGRATTVQPVGLGFDPLDKVLGGGLRAGDLLLLGGAPGAGKTTFVLQAARNIAASGQGTCLYLCYEHDEEYLATRLITLEGTGSRPGLGRERNSP